jgi:hypothetical protein
MFNTIKNFFNGFRKQHISEEYTAKQKNLGRLDTNSASLPYSVIMPSIVREIFIKIEFYGCPEVLHAPISKEIESYLKSGSCGNPAMKKCCINPTLLEFKTNKWFNCYQASPFESFYPFPYDQLKYAGNEKLFSHCRSTLKEQLIQFRTRMEKFIFFFHTGDSLQLCFTNADFKKHFDVIDCSNLIDVVGLGNLIPAVRPCLTDDPDAVLLTETVRWQLLKPTVAEYIETALGCPLSMIPLLYGGIRLVDPVHLGSFVPIMFDREALEPITLKWQTTLAFSRNIPLDISSDLKQCIDKLISLCFFTEKDSNAQKLYLSSVLRYTPTTYHYMM